MAEVIGKISGVQYAIELSFNNHEEYFSLPVLPESVEVTEKGNGKTYDIIGKGGGTEETRAGEINVIKNPGLREISFSSVFPAQWYPFVSISEESLKSPFEYIELIRKWRATKHPIRFIYAGSRYETVAANGAVKSTLDFDINIPASIEKFDWKEVAGAPGDIEYSITIKEYVFYSARRVAYATDSDGNTKVTKKPPKRPDERIRPLTYTIKPGDTLLAIAKRILGDDSRHREIQSLNGITDSQAKQLQPGLVIKIPQN